MIHDQPGQGRLMMHSVAIITDGAASRAHNTRHVWEIFAGLPLVEPAGPDQPEERAGGRRKWLPRPNKSLLLWFLAVSAE